MDGATLFRAIQNDKFCNQIFQGIYSEDTLKEILLPQKCLTFNKSLSSEKNGEHWIVIANFRTKYIDFLCSYKNKII